MHERILAKSALSLLAMPEMKINGFYLAGGTGLALQLGHRKSDDLDFFSSEEFFPDKILSQIKPERVLFSEKNTIHCEKNKTKLSFLYYKEKLLFPTIDWKGIKIADYRDIGGDKIKTIAQRGSKKDFYDVYAMLKLKMSIKELCSIYNKKFGSSGINNYHVIKSLIYFSNADEDAGVKLIDNSADWNWERVKNYFLLNNREFARYIK